MENERLHRGVTLQDQETMTELQRFDASGIDATRTRPSLIILLSSASFSNISIRLCLTAVLIFLTLKHLRR